MAHHTPPVNAQAEPTAPTYFAVTSRTDVLTVHANEQASLEAMSDLANLREPWPSLRRHAVPADVAVSYGNGNRLRLSLDVVSGEPVRLWIDDTIGKVVHREPVHKHDDDSGIRVYQSYSDIVSAAQAAGRLSRRIGRPVAVVCTEAGDYRTERNLRSVRATEDIVAYGLTGRPQPRFSPWLPV